MIVFIRRAWLYSHQQTTRTGKVDGCAGNNSRLGRVIEVMGYFENIQSGVRTTLKGLSLTMRHLRQATRRRTPVGMSNNAYFDLQTGLVTLQYPHEQLPVPDNGRYRLHNEMDDCIVCDKCAKVCPVDCITIDPIKATEEIGKASDGSPIRLYAATFDIDMAKCCYCGLCTVVCPTECLTMEKTFDYSTYELGNLTYAFANLTPVEADEKRALYEQFVREKEAAKALAKPIVVPASTTAAPARPAFRPGMKPAAKPAPLPVPEAIETSNSTEGHQLHPLTDPAPDEAEAIASVGVPEQPGVTESLSAAEVAAAPEAITEPVIPKPKPSFRPTMKPPAVKPAAETPPVELPEESVAKPPALKPKPAFRPTMKPKGTGEG